MIFMINVLSKLDNELKKSYAFVYAYVYVYRNKLFHEHSDSNVMSGSHGENLEMSVYLTPERRCRLVFKPDEHLQIHIYQ